MLKKNLLLVWMMFSVFFITACSDTGAKPDATQGDVAQENIMATAEVMDKSHQDESVIAIHTSVCNDTDAAGLTESLPKLAERGINMVFVDVGYCFQYQSHPELGEPEGLSYEAAGRITEVANAEGIEVVPEFECLGHQSWEEYTGPLLTVYPEFDETPNQYPNNEGIYCRSWCPLNEAVNPIVFDLIDELMAAFSAKAVHVGMDEVFIIADEHCPRCQGKDPGELFAKQINDLYHHIVTQNGAEMYMWADRLLDGQAMGDVYSEWEASYNGTDTAIDLIPKDIILCDWHYESLDKYPSIAYLTDAGFSVLTSSWKNLKATEALVSATAGLSAANDRVLGHMYTTWGDIDNNSLDKWKPMIDTIELLE